MKIIINSILLFAFTGVLSVSFADTANDECYMCHGELTNKVKHKVAEYNCNLCHTGHEVGIEKRYEFRLKKPVTQLCQMCHKGVGVGHIMGGHPKGNRFDPFYPDRNMTCVSCHNPHQSKMPKLIRFDYSKDTTPYQGDLCNVCHGDKTGIGRRDELPTPPRNGYGDPMEEGTPTEIRSYSPTSEDGKDVFTFSISQNLFGSSGRYSIFKNGKQVYNTKTKTTPSLTQVLTEVSKFAKDGDIVRLFATDYQGPLQVGVAPVKQFIVDVQGLAGDARVNCPTQENCVIVSGEASILRGLAIRKSPEEFFKFSAGAKREFILMLDN